VVAGVPQDERAQIDAVQRRLAQKYADLPHDHVAAVVQHVYARFNLSTVRDFVPLLVERRAREELATSTAGCGCSGSLSHALMPSSQSLHINAFRRKVSSKNRWWHLPH
jgi:hypothetical protein